MCYDVDRRRRALQRLEAVYLQVTIEGIPAIGFPSPPSVRIVTRSFIPSWA
jgi:hypothetical protein